jgi:hypothetical protein
MDIAGKPIQKIPYGSSENIHKQEKATLTVIEQAGRLCKDWAA